jgi:hypothetical protein
MKIILSLHITTTANFGSGQVFSNPITGTNPNTSNPYIIVQTVDANISLNGFGIEASITVSNANDRYNANSWNTTSTDFDGAAYTKGIVSLLSNSNSCYFDDQTREISTKNCFDSRFKN